jgi:hypothetical protein
MHEIKKNYLKILRIEINDLHADIEQFIDATKKEKEKGILTNYVFLENLTVFKNELFGIDYFFKVLDETNPVEFKTLDEMIEHIRKNFAKIISRSCISKEITCYIERKLVKVKKYVTQQNV